jgi:hypothetical protein
MTYSMDWRLGTVLCLAVAAIPVAAPAQFTQYRTEQEQRPCQTRGIFGGGTRTPNAPGGRCTETRTCQIRLSCPPVGRGTRACFQTGRDCGSWSGVGR